MPDRERRGELRVRVGNEESPRCALVDAGVSQLELTEIMHAAADALAVRRDGPTFGELAARWLESERRRLVEPENERRHLDHVKKLWPLREHELTPRVAREALLELLAPTGQLGPATVNKVQSTARRMIRDAQIDGEWRRPNPFQILKRLREPRPEYHVLSLEQARAMLPKLRRDRLREAAVMLVLGPRPGELKALRKPDLDLPRRFLTWRRSNGRDTTKTGTTRRVPIPDQLMPLLVEAMTASPCELVFPGAEGQRQRADTKLSRTLRTALAASGVFERCDYACRRKGCGHRESTPGAESRRCPRCAFKLWCRPVAPPLRWYDLRHSAASLHREAGCDPLVIKLALGHATRDITDDIYTHLSDGYLREHLNRLPSLCI